MEIQRLFRQTSKDILISNSVVNPQGDIVTKKQPKIFYELAKLAEDESASRDELKINISRIKGEKKTKTIKYPFLHTYQRLNSDYNKDTTFAKLDTEFSHDSDELLQAKNELVNSLMKFREARNNKSDDEEQNNKLADVVKKLVALNRLNVSHQIAVGEIFLFIKNTSHFFREKIPKHLQKLSQQFKGLATKETYKDDLGLSKKTCFGTKTPVALFGDEHFSFFSPHTHTISGLLGLSTLGEEYKVRNYRIGINNALSTLGVSDWILTVGSKDIEESFGELSEGHIYHLFPNENSTKEQIINFYETERKLTFYYKSIEHCIKPVLVKDKTNGRYYLHIELGKEYLHNKNKNYTIHFAGNGVSQGGQVATASNLLNLGDGRVHIIPGYPNKGINHILNPDLAAYKTSIKGSINPHLLAYNYLLHQDNDFNLEIYAHSYGNLSSAQFIKQVLKSDNDRKISFIGSATAGSLKQIAESWVGKTTAYIGELFKLLNRSDVFDALKSKNVTATIVNSTLDTLIPPTAQIQNHPELRGNERAYNNIKVIAGAFIYNNQTHFDFVFDEKLTNTNSDFAKSYTRRHCNIRHSSDDSSAEEISLWY